MWIIDETVLSSNAQASFTLAVAQVDLRTIALRSSFLIVREPLTFIFWFRSKFFTSDMETDMAALDSVAL